jgi:hypothetical protein
VAALTIALILVLVALMYYLPGSLGNVLRPALDDTTRVLAPNAVVVSKPELGVTRLLRSIVPHSRGA